MTSHVRSAGFVLVMGLAFTGCSGSPPAGSQEAPTTPASTAARTPTASTPTTPTPEPNPFAGATFDVAPNGEPWIDASGGTDPSLVITPVFWDDPEDDQGVKPWFEFSTGGGVSGGGIWPLDVSTAETGDEGQMIVEYGIGHIHFFADGTARWELDTGMNWGFCPDQTQPVTREAANVVRRGDGTVTSFTLDLQQIVSAVDCVA